MKGRGNRPGEALATLYHTYKEGATFYSMKTIFKGADNPRKIPFFPDDILI